MISSFALGPSTVRLGDLEVARMGFGAMRLPGPDVWGEPEDPARAREVLLRVIALGINLIDTAWYYGPHVSNRLIAETLHPYPKDLVIATKLGGKRLPDKGWAAFCRPQELREGCETDLRELRKDALDDECFARSAASPPHPRRPRIHRGSNTAPATTPRAAGPGRSPRRRRPWCWR